MFRTPNGGKVRPIVHRRVLARSVPVEWGMLVQDVAGLQHEVRLGVAVDVDHHGLG